MYFRDHYHVTKQNDFIKLENRILGKGNLLYECCVNGSPPPVLLLIKIKCRSNFKKGQMFLKTWIPYSTCFHNPNRDFLNNAFRRINIKLGSQFLSCQVNIRLAHYYRKWSDTPKIYRTADFRNMQITDRSVVYQKLFQMYGFPNSSFTLYFQF